MKFRFPDKPTTCTPAFVQTLRTGNYLAQAKYDGWRLLITDNQCLSRVGREMREACSCFSRDIERALKKINLPANSVLDCELVGPRGQHEHPVIYLFDILQWNGEWLTDLPYAERWDICETLYYHNPSTLEIIKLPETVFDNFLDLFNKLKTDWKKTGNTLHEGIVIKKLNGLLSLSTKRSIKSDCMFKLKYRDNQEPRY